MSILLTLTTDGGNREDGNVHYARQVLVVAKQSQRGEVAEVVRRHFGQPATPPNGPRPTLTDLDQAIENSFTRVGRDGMQTAGAADMVRSIVDAIVTEDQEIDDVTLRTDGLGYDEADELEESFEDVEALVEALKAAGFPAIEATPLMVVLER